MKAKIKTFPANELKKIPFPDCYKMCQAGQYLGVGECEAICPDKFKKGKQNESRHLLETK
jgi:hypothetical protein